MGAKAKPSGSIHEKHHTSAALIWWPLCWFPSSPLSLLSKAFAHLHAACTCWPPCSACQQHGLDSLSKRLQICSDQSSTHTSFVKVCAKVCAWSLSVPDCSLPAVQTRFKRTYATSNLHWRTASTILHITHLIPTFL